MPAVYGDLQAAMPSLGKLVLPEGVFVGDVTVPAGVKLQGAAAEATEIWGTVRLHAHSQICDLKITGSGEVGVKLQSFAHHARIDRCQILGPDYPIDALGYLAYLRVDDVYCWGRKAGARLRWGVRAARFTACRFHGSPTGSGVMIRGKSQSSDPLDPSAQRCNDLRFWGCDMSGNAIGIDLVRDGLGGAAYVADCTFRDCRLENNDVAFRTGLGVHRCHVRDAFSSGNTLEHSDESSNDTNSFNR